MGFHMGRGSTLAVVLGVMLAGHAARAQICTVAATNVAFGTYDPVNTSALSSTGTLTVTCSATIGLLVSYAIQIGAGGGGGFGARAMSAGVGRLGYQFYTTVGRTAIWGDGTSGTNVVSDGYLLSMLVPVTKPYTVYGVVPARQIVPAGTYTDTAAVLLVY